MTRVCPRIVAAIAASLAAGAFGCGKLQGTGGPAPPLVTFNVEVTGDLMPLLPAGETQPRSLRATLLWGAQWQTEPFCILPAESDQAAAVIQAGCRDSFAFVPALASADTPVEIGTPATLSLFALPSTDILVGGQSSRVGYGTFVVYDDRDGSGALELATPRRTRSGGDEGPPMVDVGDTPDRVYGASFFSMTEPDQRVSYLEGSFAPSGFYPRQGCPDPERGFRILGAGGFSATDAFLAAAAGQLPNEDPQSCTQGPADTLVSVAVRAPASVQEVSCGQRANDSSVRYREPPTDAPDFNGRVTACAHLPTFDAGNQSSLIQLVVSGRATDRCMGLTHYTLRGCRENVACPVPDWDFTATPPAWWPCPN